MSLFDQIYWVTGSVIGSVLGKAIKFNTEGIDFAMTALFAVLVVEQWKSHSKHFPAILGFAVSILSILIFGTENFIIPTLIIICVILLLFKNRLEEK